MLSCFFASNQLTAHHKLSASSTTLTIHTVLSTAQLILHLFTSVLFLTVSGEEQSKDWTHISKEEWTSETKDFQTIHRPLVRWDLVE